MKKLLFSRLLRLAALVLLIARPAAPALAQAPPWQWATSPGGGAATATVADSVGNVYITGYFDSTATFGATTLTSAGFADVFVAKLTPGGAYAWAVRVGGAESDAGVRLALDGTGNVVVMGAFGSPTIAFGATILTNPFGAFSLFVAKLTPAGIWQWAASADGASGNGLAVDRQGTTTLTGTFFGTTVTFGTTTLTSAGFADVFVAKLTSAGVWQWATSVGGTGTDGGNALALDPAGNAYLTGSFSSPTLAFGATTLTISNATSLRGELFVAKLSPAGAWLWAAQADGTASNPGYQIAADDRGGAVVLGGFYSPALTIGTTTLTSSNRFGQLFVAKLTATGTWQWATSATGGGNVEANALALDSAGNAYVAGYFTRGGSIGFGATTLLTHGEADLFVAKLNPAGAWQWATGAGGTGDDTGAGLAVAPNGAVCLTGTSESPSIAFGATLLTNPLPGRGHYRLVVAQLAPTTLALNEDAAGAGAGDVNMRLTPNPAHETVRLTGTAGAPATLLDELGRVVRTSHENLATTNINLRGLPPGVYTVRVGAATRRLVVE